MARLAPFGGITLDVKNGQLNYQGETASLAGAVASVLTEDTRNKRITVTRLAVLGPLAFGRPEKPGKKVAYITISGPTFEWLTAIEGCHEMNARKWAAQVNDAAKKIAA